MRASRWTAGALTVVLSLGACSAPAPADSPAGGTAPASAPATLEPADPARDLAGRAVAGIATGGTDVVLRIGAEGFRLPADEHLLDLHGDRVLSARKAAEREHVNLVVRDLDGHVVREIQTGMQVPQTAIVRGDDVYFAGVDVTLDANGSILEVIDRGVWLARPNAPLESVYSPESPVVYSRLNRSPDGRTVGFTRCDDTCTTVLVRERSPLVEVPIPELIALANDVAVVIAMVDDLNRITAFAIADGAERWRAETDGLFLGRYSTSDGARFVISAIEDAGDGDGNSQDQMRIELLDALTGKAEQTVLIAAEPSPAPWLAPSLSSDRYVALLDSVVPNPDEGPRTVRIIDLEAGRLLDDVLELGGVT